VPFAFSLAAVQAVRRQRERQEERALSAVLHEMQQTRLTLERIEAELRQAGASRLRAEPQPMQGVSLHEQYARMELLRQAWAEVLARLEELATQRDQQQGSYLTARRDRELLDELEQKQKTSFEAKLLQQEQKRNDDLFLARRLRR